MSLAIHSSDCVCNGTHMVTFPCPGREDPLASAVSLARWHESRVEEQDKKIEALRAELEVTLEVLAAELKKAESPPYRALRPSLERIDEKLRKPIQKCLDWNTVSRTDRCMYFPGQDPNEVALGAVSGEQR